jgi:hypothetical protein
MTDALNLWLVQFPPTRANEACSMTPNETCALLCKQVLIPELRRKVAVLRSWIVERLVKVRQKDMYEP